MAFHFIALVNRLMSRYNLSVCVALGFAVAITFLVVTTVPARYIFLPHTEEKTLLDPPTELKVATSLDEITFRNYVMKKIADLRSSLESLWCKTYNVLSTGGFCLTASNINVGGNIAFDANLCRAVEKLVGAGSVSDFGAGLGFYGMCLLKLRRTPFLVNEDQKRLHLDSYKKTMGEMINSSKVVHSWHGFDGAGNIESLSGGFIREVDLGQEKLWLGRRWDWVMSVEVGEHIPATAEKAFLDNLVRHACKGLILTWAVEGQGGHQHVNNHNNDYIKERMKERGLISDDKAESEIRKTLTLRWLRGTTMIFRFPVTKNCLDK